MMDPRTVAAQALGPLPEAFQSVNGRVLRAVFSVYVHGCLDRVILDFDQLSLAIKAKPDDDTVEVMVKHIAAIANGDYIDACSSLPCVGEPFG